MCNLLTVGTLAELQLRCNSEVLENIRTLRTQLRLVGLWLSVANRPAKLTYHAENNF